MPKLRSVISMVMTPASTGTASSSRKAVTSIDQTNSGILCRVIPGARIFRMVVMKLAAPMIELAPARCRLNRAISIAGLGWNWLSDSGV